MTSQSTALDARIGILVPLRWQSSTAAMDPQQIRIAAAALMAVYHINNRTALLVPEAAALLPENFKLVVDIQDSMALPSVAVNHAVAWNADGTHAIIGSYRSAVTGPLALVASIAATPVISWGSTASTLSDRDTYPTLSRTVINDAVLAANIVRSIFSMGWTRIAILHVNDAWGRAFQSEAMNEASLLGMQAVAFGFALADASAIERAVSQIADSGVRITLFIAFEQDIAAVAAAADRHGLLATGHAWIAANEFSIESVLLSSAEPARTVEQMSGWMTASMDALQGDRRPRFQGALDSTPIQYLNNSIFEGLMLEAVITAEGCGEYCATMYDAVWAAAIAMSKMELGADGSVDKAALLSEIREASFQGASGQVEFDRETGERSAAGQRLLIKNLRPTTETSLSQLVTWRWQSGGSLERVSSEPPVWSGGEQAWELPQEVLECEDGLVFSTSSLQCEACPKGTAKEGDECVRYDARIGILTPLRWMVPESSMAPWFLRYASSATMAAHHINNRTASLVPEAADLLPENFKLVVDIRDTMGLPSVAVNQAVKWNEDGQHIIIGALLSAVTGPLASVAAIAQTPVVSFGSTASTLTDRDAYPTLSRTVITDAILAESIIKSFSFMGWTRIAILYVNDAWGRSLAQDFTSAASEVGVTVANAADFEVGDADQIEQAVAVLSGSGARVVLCIAFQQDLPHIAAMADSYGMLNPGFAWVSAIDIEPGDTIAGSPDPEKTRAQLAGWFTATMDAFHGEQGQRFQSVLESAPLERLKNGAFENALTPSVTAGECDQYCLLAYDAVWAAAIAMSKMELGADGSVDKAALLEAIREVSFEGASGPVRFDRETGERSASGQRLLIMNLRPTLRRDGSPTLSLQVTWQWWTDTSGVETLLQDGTEPPYWPGGASTWTAPKASCAQGFVFSSASPECVPCPAGTREVSQLCEACPLGTFSALPGAIACSSCQVGYANKTGSDACYACPLNTVRSAASAGINQTECLCVVGHYRRDGPGSACRPCVTGGECPGGDNTPHPLPGYWGDRSCQGFGGNETCNQWDSFLPCNPAENCLGGADFACAAGRGGRLCLETLDGWSNVGGVFYWSCGEQGEVITVAGGIAVLLVWVGVNAVASGKYPALSIALLFVQLTAIIGGYGLKWHTNLHWINIAMGVLNFDVDFVTPSCLTPWTAVRSFYFQLGLPFIFGFAYILVLFVVELWRSWRHKNTHDETGKYLFQKVMKYCVSFVLINYQTLAVKCFQSLSCEHFPDGKYYMLFAPAVECWVGSHWVMASLAVLYIIFILIGLPVWIWIMLRRYAREGSLHSLDVEHQWGWLHRTYEADWKWWEVMLCLRRISIAFIAVMVPEPMLQGATTLVALGGLLAAHVWAAPFIQADIDCFDFVSICGSMLYTLTGMLFYPSVTQDAQGHLCTDESEFCVGEMRVKDGISIVSLTIIIGTVLAAIGISVRNVLEHQAAVLAGKNIMQIQGINREMSQRSVKESANRVFLHDILHGKWLLKWSRTLAHAQKSVKYKASAMQYMQVEQKIMGVEESLTQSDSNPTACVMRHLCELPGFVDFLLCTQSSTEPVAQFVRDLSLFLQDAEDSNVKFEANSMIKFEHRPVAAYWLSTTSSQDRMLFRMVVEAIRSANGMPSLNTGSLAVSPVPSAARARSGAKRVPSLDGGSFQTSPTASATRMKSVPEYGRQLLSESLCHLQLATPQDHDVEVSRRRASAILSGDSDSGGGVTWKPYSSGRFEVVHDVGTAKGEPSGATDEPGTYSSAKAGSNGLATAAPAVLGDDPGWPEYLKR